MMVFFIVYTISNELYVSGCPLYPEFNQLKMLYKIVDHGRY